MRPLTTSDLLAANSWAALRHAVAETAGSETEGAETEGAETEGSEDKILTVESIDAAELLDWVSL